jgi:amidase/aspartyl-tRNA(Asn)/glutamyl-tRNA(Gln) amidotransferase subunit A
VSGSPAAELLERMAGLLRDGAGWAAIDPAPTFDAAARLVDTAHAGAEAPVGRVAVAPDGVAAELNVFTSVFRDAPRPGPLADMTFAVKDLFDVEGVVTLAGSVAKADDAPATADATAVARLRRAGAQLVGATNMDEFAYGFTTENSHYGPTRNPHDPERVAGGSSGGSAVAVATSLARVALGTDTNGSVRIPAAFCGVFGLRPTYGLVPRTGSTLFAPSFDTVGPLARTVGDLALVLDAIAGPDWIDPTCTRLRAEPFASFLGQGIAGLRVARAAGELWDAAMPEVHDAAERVAAALGATDVLELPDVGRARAAAMVITAAEGADQHQELLRTTPEIVDVRVRDRFLSGLGVSATDYLAAQRFRRAWQARVLPLLDEVDVLVLPTVACTAPLIDQPTIEIGGVVLPTGAVLGRFTQPLSFIGLPALSVPLAGADGLPIGVQLAGRPGSDGILLAAAAALEAAGVVGAIVPSEEVAA